MKVKAYAADQSGCGCYRVIYPARALQRQGADVELIEPGDDEAHLKLICVDDLSTGEPRVIDAMPIDADAIVLQRPLMRIIADAIPHVQRQGVAVIVEVDDDFSSIHPRNPAFSVSNPATHPEMNWSHLERACRLADLVTVTTPALAAVYGRHGRVAVLPNCLPDGFYDTPPALNPWMDRRADTWIGWSGSVATHPTDLNQTRGAVGRALQGTSAGLYVVGSGVGVREALHVNDDQPFQPSDWKPIVQYAEAMARIDVGIVPLALSRFNEAKSYLKGLEMAGLGIPFVASPTGPYVALAALGAGLIARKPNHWEAMLKALIRSPLYRADVADRGRAAVDQMRYSTQAHLWWEAWEQAVKFHSSRHAEHARSTR